MYGPAARYKMDFDQVKERDPNGLAPLAANTPSTPYVTRIIAPFR
jgi:hypothetical protein